MTTAVEKLRPSTLLSDDKLRQRDIDLVSLNLALKGKASLSIEENVIDGSISRTIEGASTVRVSLLDRDRNILNSGRLKSTCDILLDGLWFRLVMVEKSGDRLNLTFEDREVSIMRGYRKKKIVKRGKMTRERFVESMIREVKEFKIPYVIPALDKFPTKNPTGPKTKTRVAVDYEKGNGFAAGPAGAPAFSITVRHLTATQEQISNTDKVLRVGASMGAPRPCMVAAVIVINEETNARNLSYSGDGLSAGLFQQIYKPHQYAWGTKEQVMDIQWASEQFFTKAIAAYKKNPSITPEYIALEGQVAGNQEDRIIPIWRTFRQEAERTVSRWGYIPGAAPLAAANAQDPAAFSSASQGVNGEYSFTRGLPAIVNGVKKIKFEDTWTCTGRMADEVQMRRFMSAGTFYFITEHQLFTSAPRMRVCEDTDGVDSIDFRYDVYAHHSQSDNSHTANVTITAWIDRWTCPPGSTIEIFDMGVLNGRWLVTDVDRPLFSQKATITCKKPKPKLPEPNLDRDALVDRELGEVLDHPATTDVPEPSLEPTPSGSSADLAKQILAKHALGFYSDDNGHQVEQLKQVAAGRKLRNSNGDMVDMNPRVLGAILSLLNHGYYIGTYALCSDHSYSVKGSGNVSQHSLGEAVDISSVGLAPVGREVIGNGRPGTTQNIKEVMLLLRKLQPYDLICAGNGQYDPSVANLQLDNTVPKGGEWVSGHRDHIHVSFARGNRDAP